MGLGTSLSCDISMNTRLSADDRSKYQNPDLILSILNGSRTIAIVGLSDKKERASNFVGSYLKSERYIIIPVNPMKQEILGEKCYPDLASIPVQVDVVDIFRRTDECVNIVREAIAIKAKTVWMQMSNVNMELADMDSHHENNVVQDLSMTTEL